MKYERYVKDGCLAWTLTSNGYKYLTWNFALLWQRAKCSAPLMVVCADKPSYQFLSREGISCVLWDKFLNDFGPQVVPFGSRQFSTLNRVKLALLNTFAGDPAVQQCLYFDGDIAIYKDVVSDIRARLAESTKGVLCQCDEKPKECSADSATATACPNFCTGVVAFKHGGDGGIFKITDEALWAAKPEDQVWVNDAAKQLGVSVAILPRELYPNGARCSLTHSTPELKMSAFLLHYNYRVGGTKVADMKRFGDWLLVY
jgi:hypothetical protein